MWSCNQAVCQKCVVVVLQPGRVVGKVFTPCCASHGLAHHHHYCSHHHQYFFHPAQYYFAHHGCKGGCRQKLEHPGRLRLGAAGGGREEAKNNPSGQDLPPILPNLHLVYHQHCIAWSCQVGPLWYRWWEKNFDKSSLGLGRCLWQCACAGLPAAGLSCPCTDRLGPTIHCTCLCPCLCVFVSSSLYLL